MANLCPKHPQHELARLKIDKYSGTTSFESFISNFNRHSDFLGIGRNHDQRKEILDMYLKNEVKSKLRHYICAHPNDTYGEVIDYLRETFAGPHAKDQVAVKISSLRQKSKESVSKFYGRIFATVDLNIDEAVSLSSGLDLTVV